MSSYNKNPKLPNTKSMKDILTKEFLEYCYSNKMTIQDVADSLMCSYSVVKKYNRIHGVKCYDPREDKDSIWKGGTWTGCDRKFWKGYVFVYVSPGVVEREHRLIVQDIIGRNLEEDEVIHHIDGDGTNNNPSNLILTTKRLHDYFHLYCNNHRIIYQGINEYGIIEILRKYSKYPNVELKMYADLAHIVDNN